MKHYWLSLFSVVLMATSTIAQRYEKLSPFDMVRWQGETPQVKISDTWYESIKINGIAVAEILFHAKKEHGRKWDKRFCEDIVQLLTEMGHKPSRLVDLSLKDLRTGKTVEKHAVPMTEEKRRIVLLARPRATAPAQEKSSLAVKRIKRKHTASEPAKYADLILTYKNSIKTRRLTSSMIAEDLDQLEYLIENEFSYARLRGIDYKKMLDAIRFAGRNGASLADFHIQLRKLIGKFGDGHARARGVFALLPRRCTPFGFVDVGKNVVALDSNNRLIDSDFPYVAAIAGRPISDWLEKAAANTAQGSRQFNRLNALRTLSFIDYVAQGMGLECAKSITFVFRNKKGEESKKEITLVSRPTFPRLVLSKQTQKLKGNLGYIRLANMRSKKSFLDALDLAMQSFKETRGLIIDVRNNGGGSRMALRTLLPYFLDPKASPKVCNVARYRLPQGILAGRPEGYLANRFLYPLLSTRWNKNEREAIIRFAKSFRPAWQVNPQEFSTWHYMLIDAKSNPRAFHYKSPVVVLINEGCFSATDIFVAAFKGQKGVTIMGTATGGGSGRSLETQLAWSKIRVRLSSMASFQPLGQLYDGQGIQPDVRAAPHLDDWLGRSDSVLEKALR